MQELACAPRISLIIGKRTLDWDMLNSFLGDAQYSDAFHMEWGHGTVGPMAGETFSKVKTIQNQRTMMQAGQRSSLMDVLERFKGSKSTDPRDKIYGLLGLTLQSREMMVDYRKSAVEVYTEVTTIEINGGANLDIITQNPFQVNDSTERLAGLPSWVPDFSCNMYDDYSTQYSSILFAQRWIYSASSAECKVPCDLLSDRVLRLRGTIIGRVDPYYSMSGNILPTQSPNGNSRISMRIRSLSQLRRLRLVGDVRKWGVRITGVLEDFGR
ncbi:hypothetical protein VC83_01006 [Pseudogymnoascus destructans]|uniref:Heterokaryon incompatibility domain-containing protein n=2 Tax=Pseudogymnoascus destructans TaxID=655981 RepID=L8G5W9_PSED2|nr:uncharacterized protein VC83_01006 [Pseudogymnoascus destructans]ELR07371.1 hypothetical protein GMDG_08386 [Pseudogymnoascus destructans 20631-21]OAF62508.1 hypothetical protein VC83_01006 [Pseudogymnoascus destructans]